MVTDRSFSRTRKSYRDQLKRTIVYYRSVILPSLLLTGIPARTASTRGSSINSSTSTRNDDLLVVFTAAPEK